MTVLIVDDDEDGVDSVSRIVDRNGHEAVGFTSGEAFLASDLDGDVLLLKNHMPDPKGYDVLRELGARNRQIPTVMIADPAFSEEGLVVLDRLGLKGIVNQPHNLQDVADSLEHAVTYQGRLSTKSAEQMLFDLDVKGRSL